MIDYILFIRCLSNRGNVDKNLRNTAKLFYVHWSKFSWRLIAYCLSFVIIVKPVWLNWMLMHENAFWKELLIPKLVMYKETKIIKKLVSPSFRFLFQRFFFFRCSALVFFVSNWYSILSKWLLLITKRGGMEEIIFPLIVSRIILWKVNGNLLKKISFIFDDTEAAEWKLKKKLMEEFFANHSFYFLKREKFFSTRVRVNFPKWEKFLRDLVKMTTGFELIHFSDLFFLENLFFLLVYFHWNWGRRRRGRKSHWMNGFEIEGIARSEVCHKLQGPFHNFRILILYFTLVLIL